MNDQSNRSATPFVPLLLVMIGLLIWSGAQMYQLFSERSTLKTLLANQAAPFAASQKLRGQLDAVASGTQRLADQGNQNARIVVEELRKRGITINPAAAPVELPTPGGVPAGGASK
ncbi:MAG: hypothetical protein ACK515_03165 [bacterium]|nr:hypothetical protein [Betaproteobacteria bacterium]